MATIYKPIITRIDTTANWKTLNPVPANGEQCIEVLGGGLFKLKIGDGVSPWIALNYYQGSSGSAEDLSKLITPDKSSLVAAINSVQTQINALAASLSSVATSGDYNDLINKLTAGTGIEISDENVISATGTPPTPTPVEEYDSSTEGLLIHNIVIISDEDGDLVLDGVNGEIIPIYDEEGDGSEEYDPTNNSLTISNISEEYNSTNDNLTLDNNDGEMEPVETEESQDTEETEVDGNVTTRNVRVVSYSDGDLVLESTGLNPGE